MQGYDTPSTTTGLLVLGVKQTLMIGLRYSLARCESSGGEVRSLSSKSCAPSLAYDTIYIFYDFHTATAV